MNVMKTVAICVALPLTVLIGCHRNKQVAVESASQSFTVKLQDISAVRMSDGIEIDVSYPLVMETHTYLKE